MTPPLKPITALELKAALEAKASLRLLDVREPAEFTSELGHIDGAELIPLATVPAQLAQLSKDPRELVVICKSGARSGRAAQLLADNGLKARSLEGGMLAWTGAKLPIVR